jgi:predicted amidophosphoribosyltransferase
MLERGFNPAELLARELSASVPGLTWRNLLTRNRKTKDQSKLAPAARTSNQLGSMSAPAGNLSVLLIDDVVTTGATLLEAASTLQKAGHSVHGFLTFAETEAKKV